VDDLYRAHRLSELDLLSHRVVMDGQVVTFGECIKRLVEAGLGFPRLLGTTL
jgi:hypothetical protein